MPMLTEVCLRLKTKMAISTFQTFSGAFHTQLLLIIMAALTIRLSVSMWGHSGEGKPPLFGDFEAQRHWMEITTNLPFNEWYVDTRDNDLQYWGLDYPPLTAYHMMLNGKVAQHVNSSFVELSHSRGLETPNIKIFMRATVILMDVLIFLPAAIAYFILQREKDDLETDVLICIMVLVGYPGLVLIDCGHFQYNNVSLALIILATLALSLDQDVIGAVIFCLALNYKQMELYHALPFFAYLLGRCFKKEFSKGLYQFVILGLVVIITFLAIWSPFLENTDSFLAVLTRLFPVNRGLYEDKVATFWCSISVIIKFKKLVSQGIMALICLMTTGLLLLPSFSHLLRNPSMKNFHYSMISTSLIFFLFSFHVHEKTILLAAVPAILIIKTDTLAVIWFLLISVFSMLPLLVKDELLVPTISTTSLFWIIVNHFLKPTQNVRKDLKVVFQVSTLSAVCLSLAFIFIPPPSRYPDIFTLLIAIFSCAHFIMFAIYFHLRQFNSSFSIHANDSLQRTNSVSKEASYKSAKFSAKTLNLKNKKQR